MLAVVLLSSKDRLDTRHAKEFTSRTSHTCSNPLGGKPYSAIRVRGARSVSTSDLEVVREIPRVTHCEIPALVREKMDNNAS